MTFYNLLLLFISGNIASFFLAFIINIKTKDDDFSLSLFNKEIFRLGRLLFVFILILI
jgi:hypothetical protein